MRALLLPACLLVALFLRAQAGALDLTFDPDGTAGDSSVLCIREMPDGGFLIAGFFGTYNGVARPGLAKLRSDGTLDEGFAPQVDAVSPRTQPVVLPDGRIITAVPGTGLVRLFADGSVDPGFQAVGCSAYAIRTIAVQPDGKLVVGGDFWEPFRRVMRLNADGSLDTTFDPGEGVEGLTGWIASIAVQPDGRVILAGGMSGFDDSPHNGLVRLMPDGAVDPSFTASLEGFGYGANIHQVVLQPDGRILVGGGFTQMNGAPAGSIARLMPDGSLDASFLSGSGFDAPPYTSQPYRAHVWGLAVQPDGAILAGGRFNSYNGAPCSNVTRLLSDGTVDASFVTGTGCNGDVQAMVLQDGKVLVGGSFTAYNGVAQGNLLRLRAPACLSTGLVSAGEENSCGLTDVMLDGTTTLWAVEAVGADGYRFELSDVDGGDPIRLTSNGRSLTLAGAEVQALVPDHTYDVRVQALIAGRPMSCGTDAACPVHISPEAGLSTAIGDAATSSTEARLWPNPSRGDHVHLAWGPARGPVQAEVIDRDGRMLLRTQLLLGNGTGVLPLEAALADGLYTVRLTANGQRTNQRLVVQH